MSFPFALAALGCASIAGLYQAVFEGLQRYDLTNGILFTGTLSYAAGAFLLVPRYGVPGLAAAQLLQWVLVLSAFLAASVRSPVRMPLLPRMWSTGALRQLIGFGSRVQGMALLAYIGDPVTKWIVTSVAGIAATAYLDMGARFVGIIRQVVVGAAAPLVPVVASLTTETPVLMADRYRRALRLMLVLAPALLLAPAALAPSISLAWIARYEPLLVQALIVLSIAWCVNAVSAPAYFFLLGSGRVRYLFAGHLVTALGTVFLGLPGGWLWGYTGVLIACGAAVAAGSSLALLGIGRTLFPGSHPPLLAAIRDTALIYSAAVAASLLVAHALPGGPVATVLAAAIFAAGGALAVTRAGGWGDLTVAFAAFARTAGRERP
jgi:O-antigen/teichoic acid export membrane protein